MPLWSTGKGPGFGGRPARRQCWGLILAGRGFGHCHYTPGVSRVTSGSAARVSWSFMLVEKQQSEQGLPVEVAL